MIVPETALVLAACISCTYVAYRLYSLFRAFYTWSHNWSMPVDLALYQQYGEWAVVTGCTDGIGLEMAKILHKSGYRLILVGRNKDKLDSVATLLPGSLTVICNYSEQNMCIQSLHNTLVGKSISILINNAGICQEKETFASMNMKYVDEIMRVNVVNTMRITNTVMDRMHGGVVANIASASALNVCPYMSAYAASKAAMIQWGRSMRSECRAFLPNVVVQNYTPYFISTKMSEMNPTVTIPTAEDWAKSALSQLGRDDTTGYIYHDMMKYVLSLMSEKDREMYILTANQP